MWTPDRFRNMYQELPDGTLIEGDVLGIAKEIMERFPNVKIQYLDPQRTDDISSAPYRVVERGRDNLWHEILAVWTLDRRVIDDLYAMQFFGAKELAAREKALRDKIDRESQAKFRDSLDEANDMALHALNSKRSSYTLDTGAGVKKLDLWNNQK